MYWFLIITGSGAHRRWVETLVIFHWWFVTALILTLCTLQLYIMHCMATVMATAMPCGMYTRHTYVKCTLIITFLLFWNSHCILSLQTIYIVSVLKLFRIFFVNWFWKKYPKQFCFRIVNSLLYYKYSFLIFL